MKTEAWELSKEEVSKALAHELALEDLEDAGVTPNSGEGREFLFRVNAFGIMGANPPGIAAQVRTQEPQKRNDQSQLGGLRPGAQR